MEKPDHKIIEFIRKHHVLTLATVNDNIPWCSNCFYCYLEDENMLVFTSDNETRHINEAINNENVAGSIVLETEIVGKIQGIQFEGKLFRPEAELGSKSKTAYIKRFPYAILDHSPVWVLEMYNIKFTNNLLGFGKKLIWKKNNL
jgi:uncharacterized protein YhbP (UPF0306 family)